MRRRSRNLREVAAGAQLRDGDRNVAGLDGQGPLARAVAPVFAGAGALVPFGPDVDRRAGVDELLVTLLDQPADVSKPSSERRAMRD